MNIYSKIRFPKRFDQSVWRLVSGIVVAVLFFVAFVFSYALPASAPTVTMAILQYCRNFRYYSVDSCDSCI